MSDENEIPEIAVDLHILDKLKARAQLARKIESSQHKVQKENHERKWLRETAEAMELALDSDFRCVLCLVPMFAMCLYDAAMMNEDHRR
jgi:hypothetical protein